MKQLKGLKLLVIASIMMLQACATTPTIETPKTACSVFDIITYSGSKDTQETVKQIRGHNATWRELCVQQQEEK